MPVIQYILARQDTRDKKNLRGAVIIRTPLPSIFSSISHNPRDLVQCRVETQQSRATSVDGPICQPMPSHPNSRAQRTPRPFQTLKIYPKPLKRPHLKGIIEIHWKAKQARHKNKLRTQTIASAFASLLPFSTFSSSRIALIPPPFPRPASTSSTSASALRVRPRRTRRVYAKEPTESM